MSTAVVQQPWPRITAEEYFRLEATSVEKHEFRDGELISMSGGTNNHSLITMNTAASLWNLLKGGPCRVYDSNLRVRVRRYQSYVYPDISVICGETESDPDDPTGLTYLTPRLVVEVLSPSTESYNRTKKFDRYRQQAAFREYVLISQESARVETFYRYEDGSWTVSFATDINDSLRLRSIDVSLKLIDVYSNVVFPPPTPDPFDEQPSDQVEKPVTP